MLPYLAIIKDSFREAFVSRVLWILLVLSTLVLLLLAPLGLEEQSATELLEDDLLDAPALAARIESQGKADRQSPGRRIWTLADEKLRLAIERRPPASSDRRTVV